MYQPLNHRMDPRKEYVKVFVVVAVYWTVSMITVFVNKLLLNSETFKLDAPLFVTWSQCVVSTLICYGMGRLSKWQPALVRFPTGNPLCIRTIKNVLPVSIMFTVMIATNNLCLKYVGVAFYYIGRSLTTVFNVIFSYLLLKQKTSLSCLLCCLAIIGGFFMGVDQESLTASFSLIGTVYGVVGSLALSLYSIYNKKVLPFVNQEIWLLSYYNNFYSTILFMPFMIYFGEFKSLYNYENIGAAWFWASILISGVCGLAIGYVTSLQIQVTSPLTHNVSGTAKACTQTVIATQIYQETKSVSWWLSNVVILNASALYAWFKQREMRVSMQEKAKEEESNGTEKDNSCV